MLSSSIDPAASVQNSALPRGPRIQCQTTKSFTVKPADRKCSEGEYEKHLVCVNTKNNNKKLSGYEQLHQYEIAGVRLYLMFLVLEVSEISRDSFTQLVHVLHV